MQENGDHDDISIDQAFLDSIKTSSDDVITGEYYYAFATIG